jgi:phage recombination protein Bet
MGINNSLVKAVAQIGGLAEVEISEVVATLRQTVMPASVKVTDEQFTSFLAVAAQYNLNPFVKQIYAFDNKRGGIGIIVSIDGWAAIVNRHEQYDGIEFEESFEADGSIRAITAIIYRKDRTRPTRVTEYYAECARGSEPWKQWPIRMLRHKAFVQSARLAFGISGIHDEDEAERIVDAVTREKAQPVDPTKVVDAAAKPEAPKAGQRLLQHLQGGKSEAPNTDRAEELRLLIGERSAALLAADDEEGLRAVVADLRESKFSKEELAPLRDLFATRIKQVQDAQPQAEPGEAG